LPLVFPLIFVAVYLSHLTLLRLPYYWDEAGYYIPAAYDLLRTGSLIPYSTLSNAHPPLPSLYLAAWWKLSGFAPYVTRTAMCLVASFALLGVYRLALVVTRRTQVAVATLLLTALYPVWFAQSTLAHADIFAAAGTLWGLAFFLNAKQKARLPIAAAICFALAALSKETAVVTPLALVLYEGALALRKSPTPSGTSRNEPAHERRRSMWNALALLASLLPLCGWFAYHWHKTGYVFGNPEYLRYNATATLDPLRILLALAHRVMHLTAHMNMFVPVLCALAALLLPPRTEPPRTDPARPEYEGSAPPSLEASGLRPSSLRLPRPALPRPALPQTMTRPLVVVLFVNLLFFSVIGGALLTRYLLPAYAIVLLFCVFAFYRRVRPWTPMVALSSGAFLIGLFLNPPYRFAPEDNLAYRDVIILHQEAIHQILTRYPGTTVLTAWPATDELSKPELGYVKRPIPVAAIDNFSLPQIERAASLPQPYTVGFIFSTKYDPPHLPFSLGPRNERLDQRFFDFHHDLLPQQIAALLGGKVTWQDQRKGQWSAVLHFDRPQLAWRR
jgi:4-amino-4-deoxy-L-arabinose transferase-like glycosyltransferase